MNRDKNGRFCKNAAKTMKAQPRDKNGKFCSKTAVKAAKAQPRDKNGKFCKRTVKSTGIVIRNKKERSVKKIESQKLNRNAEKFISEFFEHLDEFFDAYVDLMSKSKDKKLADLFLSFAKKLHQMQLDPKALKVKAKYMMGPDWEGVLMKL